MADANEREAIAVLVKKTEQKFGGPSLSEFANDPPTRKHYAVAEAILREFDVTSHTEDAPGEVSDAQVDAAASAWSAAYHRYATPHDAMRAALRAASETGGAR